MSDLEAEARRWIEGDPDPVTRQKLAEVLASGDEERLGAIVGAPLMFGTAGIRGEVGPGPSRMNRALVIKTTWALGRYLREEDESGPVVVGFDARPTSAQFAADAVGVLAAEGFEVRFFSEPTPTPLVAFAAKKLAASAAVVVTASHNPPQDNGYKVYGANASQIVSPADQTIQIHMATSPPASEIPRLEAAITSRLSGVEAIGQDVVDDYWSEIAAVRQRQSGSDLMIVYTPLHGVGYSTLHAMMERAGHNHVIPVPEQVQPDGTFPTVDFPNPEEPGALDLALSLATDRDADLILANDPDADRLAVVIPTDNGWRILTGNEIGALLGEYLLSGYDGAKTPVVASSIVSSPLMGQIAAKYGAVFERTLTGFKWIMSAVLERVKQDDGVFLFGYEEALGYSVGPAVRDKDGISAAVVFADLVADLRDRGLTVEDFLVDLWKTYGMWVSTQTSFVRPGKEGAAAIESAVSRLALETPDRISGLSVEEFTDFRTGAKDRPPWLGAQPLLELRFGNAGRVLVRPSGTEPKLKIYVDLTEPLSPDPSEQYETLKRRAQGIGETLGQLLDL